MENQAEVTSCWFLFVFYFYTAVIKLRDKAVMLMLAGGRGAWRGLKLRWNRLKAKRIKEQMHHASIYMTHLDEIFIFGIPMKRVGLSQCPEHIRRCSMRPTPVWRTDGQTLLGVAVDRTAWLQDPLLLSDRWHFFTPPPRIHQGPPTAAPPVPDWIRDGSAPHIGAGFMEISPLIPPGEPTLCWPQGWSCNLPQRLEEWICQLFNYHSNMNMLSVLTETCLLLVNPL